MWADAHHFEFGWQNQGPNKEYKPESNTTGVIESYSLF